MQSRQGKIISRATGFYTMIYLRKNGCCLPYFWPTLQITKQTSKSVISTLRCKPAVRLSPPWKVIQKSDLRGKRMKQVKRTRFDRTFEQIMTLKLTMLGS